jgi:type I restriction enzyme S subunit
MTIYNTVRLCDVATIERDSIDPKFISDGSLYVGLENIQSGGRILNVPTVSLGDIASTKFRFGRQHLLYGKLRPYLAKIAIPNFEGICSTDILPVLPGPKLDRAYLAYFLRQPSMIDYANSRSEGINLPRLSPKALAEFQIPLPPLAEQKRVALLLDQVAELQAKRERSLELKDQFPGAIFNSMFSQRPRAAAAGQCRALAELVRAGEQINYGVVQPGDDVESGVSLIRVANVVSGDFSNESLKKIAPSIEANYKRSRLHGDEILVACVGSVGEAYPFDSGSAICSV